MVKRIDSTLYFFQYLTARIIVVGIIGFLIYSIITKDIGGIIFCSLAVIFAVFILKKQVPKPSDLSFDEKFIYLDNRTEPIEIQNITSLENGVILYKLDGKISKIPLPNYYFIDKNYKELKRVIENKSTKTQQRV